MGKSYHHGELKSELIQLGIKDLESEGAENLSLRKLAEQAGVSKMAPYRHFPDKEYFLGALVNWGYHELYQSMQICSREEELKTILSTMGERMMQFAMKYPSLYRLMNSELICRMPDELMEWPRKALALLMEITTGSETRSVELNPETDSFNSVAVWAYLHGLIMLRIDNLYPDFLPLPDWNKLAGHAGLFIRK